MIYAFYFLASLFLPWMAVASWQRYPPTRWSPLSDSFDEHLGKAATMFLVGVSAINLPLAVWVSLSALES